MTTLALFAEHEKPQISPGLAVSFTEMAGTSGSYPYRDTGNMLSTAVVKAKVGARLCLFLLGFCSIPDKTAVPEKRRAARLPTME
jgi:hypothetical protein